jgi:hypothetical protein
MPGAAGGRLAKCGLKSRPQGFGIREADAENPWGLGCPPPVASPTPVYSIERFLKAFCPMSFRWFQFGLGKSLQVIMKGSAIPKAKHLLQHRPILMVGAIVMLAFLLACNPSQPASTSTPTLHPGISLTATNSPTSFATLPATPIPPTETATVRATATKLAPGTKRPDPTATATLDPFLIPTATATLDLASLVTRTPAPPAECPIIDPELKPEFDFGSDRESDPVEQVYAFLQAGGDPALVIDAHLERHDWMYERYIRYIDINGDATAELIYVNYSLPGLYVFACQDGSYTQFNLKNDYDFELGVEIREVSDINRNGVPEIVFLSDTSAYLEIDIWEWSDTGFSILNPRISSINSLRAYDCRGVFSSSPIRIEDTNGDGLFELILNQDIPVIVLDAVKGGPWRPETRTCGWNGVAFVLINRQFSQPKYRFQALQDADFAMAVGDFDSALALYQDVIFSDELDWWSPDRQSHRIVSIFADLIGEDAVPEPVYEPAEYFHLAAYARFRIMVLHLLQGDESAAGVNYRSLQDGYPIGQHGRGFAELATEFWNEYQLSGSITAACEAAVQFAASKPEMLDYLGGSHHGWQMKNYEPLDVCPFTD